MPTSPYLRAVGMAVLQAGVSGTWIAARELSPARRRLARAGTVAALAAVSYAVTPDKTGAAGDEIALAPHPFPVSDPPAATQEPEFVFDKRKAALTAGALALSVAALVGRRQLEKRWLARLTRKSHPHPTRALAVRMATVEFAGILAVQLADAHKEARAR
ncbi:hypothetical protein [Actinoplanes derwentensis]|uniref:Uncharacterized protein n=1 Tax=Actinoplanes derwentensis TaxID=113562 RepID=A0A1H2DEF8_9ACTN|nr:hypothetical protein [Actinoplanes derwentensis]GID84784.1 hypothetical protein Ade03nite_37080 [Actinoplanes derwentensis]SDT81101.1 hypothetical protein SAMN04489716_9495 [Actinoplanes derwentensis]